MVTYLMMILTFLVGGRSPSGTLIGPYESRASQTLTYIAMAITIAMTIKNNCQS